VDKFVCVSKESARVAALQGVGADRLRTLWNGIDTSKFAATGSQGSGPAVLVARLSPEKDVATLLRATAVVVRQQPSFRLEIAGQGPCLAELKALANELDLGKNVAFLGEVHDIASLLTRARFFVGPQLRGLGQTAGDSIHA
jgi:glycosyltransferase involved in cell wall biosynthesis